MNKRRFFAALCIMVILSVLCACAPQAQKFNYGKYLIADGTEELDLEANGHFTISKVPSGFVDDYGTFSVNSTELTFITSAKCHPNDVAFYDWSIKGTKLTFKPNSYDTCSTRQEVMNNTVWSLKK